MHFAAHHVALELILTFTWFIHTSIFPIETKIQKRKNCLCLSMDSGLDHAWEFKS